MNAQQLKNAILQEAIEGRLVPQDPNDEPASILLEKIRKEKERLVKEGKLKKKDLEVKPISEDEIPFEIPESWEWVRIKSIFSMQAGKNVTSADISDEQNEVFKYPCYGGNGLRGFVKGYNTEGVFPIVGRQGALCGNVNVASGQFWATEHAVVTDGYGMTPYKWQYYFLIALNLNQYATATAQPGLAVSNVVEVPIPLPPLAEQKRIVEKIEELLPKVEEYGKAQDELNKLNDELPERLKKSILQEAIEGRLVPQDPNDEPASVLLQKIREEKQQLVKAGKLKKKDLIETPISEDEIPFAIPDTWEWVRLGTITTVLGGKRIPAGRKLSLKKTDHVYIRVSDMKEDTVSTDNLQYVPDDIYPSISRYIINKEDIYITVAGTIGKIGKIPPELDGANLTENADRLVFSFINQDWLIKCLQSIVVQSQIVDVTTKVGQPKLAILRIQHLLIPLPPHAEQKRIVAKIEQLLGEIDKLKK